MRGMPVIDGSRLRASRACRSDRPGTPGRGAIGRDVNPKDAVLGAAVRRPPMVTPATLTSPAVAVNACNRARQHRRIAADRDASY